MRLPFLEDTSPPPFYQPQLSDSARTRLDKWYIGERSQAYYLKRFEQIDKAGKLIPKWHWAAFFMAFGWLLYRKRYMDCFVYCVAGVSFIKLTIVITLALLEFLLIGRLESAIQMPLRVAVGIGIWLFWASLVARWADAYYYRMARREIADALELYQGDLQAQERHLKHHGGVSLVGLVVAFGLFGTVLGIIATQFVPLIANHKEQALIFESYQAISSAKARVENAYQTLGSCPTHLPLSAKNDRYTMAVLPSLEGVDTDCAVRLTVKKAGYPVRYLNGQTLDFYRTVRSDGSIIWRCQSSLNQQKTPKRCVE